MIETPLFYVVAIVAVLIVGISKGGFVGGFGIVAVPMMAMIIDRITFGLAQRSGSCNYASNTLCHGYCGYENFLGTMGQAFTH